MRPASEQSRKTLKKSIDADTRAMFAVVVIVNSTGFLLGICLFVSLSMCQCVCVCVLAVVALMAAKATTTTTRSLCNFTPN